FVDQETDRHHGQPVATDRLEPRAAEHLRLLADGEELGQRGSVDVGVEDAGLEAERRKSEREIDRGGRLANAALAGGNRNDRLDPGHALHGLATRAAARAWRRARVRRRRRRGAGLALGGQRDHRGGDARQRAHRLLRALTHAFPGLDLGGVDGDREEYLAVAGDHLGQRAGLRQRRALGRWYGFETRQHLLFGRHGSVLRPGRAATIGGG